MNIKFTLCYLLTTWMTLSHAVLYPDLTALHQAALFITKSFLMKTWQGRAVLTSTIATHPQEHNHSSTSLSPMAMIQIVYSQVLILKSSFQYQTYTEFFLQIRRTFNISGISSIQKNYLGQPTATVSVTFTLLQDLTKLLCQDLACMTLHFLSGLTFNLTKWFKMRIQM